MAQADDLEMFRDFEAYMYNGGDNGYDSDSESPEDSDAEFSDAEFSGVEFSDADWSKNDDSHAWKESSASDLNLTTNGI